MGDACDGSVMLRGVKLGNRAAKIEQELVALHARAYDDTGQGRQPRMQVVAAPLLEKLRELRRPVERTNFGAVGEDRVYAAAAKQLRAHGCTVALQIRIDIP